MGERIGSNFSNAGALAGAAFLVRRDFFGEPFQEIAEGVPLSFRAVNGQRYAVDDLGLSAARPSFGDCPGVETASAQRKICG